MTNHNPNSTIPNATMKMSLQGRVRLRATERAVYRYYNDMGKDKGHCTWGVGILAHKGVCTKEEMGKKVSVEMVDREFEKKITETEGVVRRNIHVPLNQAQFDALCSLSYNAGAKGSFTTFNLVNKGDFAGAAANMALMIKVQVVEKGKKKYVIAPGLIKRRAEESAPFLVKDASTAASK
jgi:lysozyme